MYGWLDGRAGGGGATQANLLSESAELSSGEYETDYVGEEGLRDEEEEGI